MSKSTTAKSLAPPPPRPRRSRVPPIVVKKSAIQGSGVFATRAIKKGESIVEYVGERISHDEADKRYDDESMSRHHTFLFSIDADTCIDGGVDGNDSRFINHSCAPNAWSRADGDRIFIIAGRAIAEGDEILYDYSYTIESGDTLEKLKALYPCHCGAAKCRGTLAEVPVAKGAIAAKRAPAKKAKVPVRAKRPAKTTKTTKAKRAAPPKKTTRATTARKKR